jgi:hypothetical protein
MRTRHGLVLIGLAGMLTLLLIVVVLVARARRSDVVEAGGDSGPGPVCELTPTAGLDDTTLIAQQRELEADSRRVEAYGAEHTDQFGQAWFDNGPVVRLAVGFTGDVERHRAALEALVEHPDRLVVHEVPYSVQDLERTLADVTDLVEADTGAGLEASSIQLCSVRVGLPPGQEALAGELVDRYGDVLDVTVGGHRFPVEPGSALACPDVTGEPASVIPGLAVEARVDAQSLPRGRRFEGVVSVTNAAEQDLTISHAGEAVQAFVVGPGTGSPVGTWTAVRGDAVRQVTVEPGETVDLRWVAGVSACDASAGTAVAAGPYGVVVPIEVSVAGQPRVVVTPEVPIVVV